MCAPSPILYLNSGCNKLAILATCIAFWLQDSASIASRCFYSATFLGIMVFVLGNVRDYSFKEVLIVSTTKPIDAVEAAKKEKEPRFFDAAIYAKKLQDALTELAKKTPGELSGSVGKSEILKSGAAQMQQLVEAGFTLKQISDAISNDVFKILPKSLTEVLHGKKEKTVRKTKVTKTDTENASKGATEAAKQPSDSSTSKADKGSKKADKAATQEAAQAASVKIDRQAVDGNNASFAVNEDTPDGEL